MPSLGAFKTAKSIEEALESAQEQQVPILVTYEIPASRIENTVINMTVEGRAVYLALDPEAEGLETQLARFQLRRFNGSLLDQHGNVLKKALVTSNDMVEAVENHSDLVEASRAQFEQSLSDGRRLVDERRFKKALRVLSVFAFAQGVPEAQAGNALFEQVAQVAMDAYRALLEGAPDFAADGADKEQRDAWVKKLRKFSRVWKASPAGRAARQQAQEWKALPLE